MGEPYGAENPFSDDTGTITIEPERKARDKRKKRRQPRYNVVLWDSDDHSYDYVESMLKELFAHEPEQCHEIAKTVNDEGRAIVLTTTLEHAELKRDQIHAYGKDDVKGCTGSMWSTIEPCE